MMLMEFKKGDRVIANNRFPAFNGRTGTVMYVSGKEYWVKFDGVETIEGGLHPWYFDPMATEARLETLDLAA